MLSNIGHIELDLPERPEKAAQPPVQPTDPYSRYGPKAEISHIFRVPEKLPAKQLSLVFLGLTVLPFIAFLIGVSLLSLVNIFRTHKFEKNIIAFVSQLIHTFVYVSAYTVGSEHKELPIIGRGWNIRSLF